ncbi:MAG TPA: MFS transporter [Phycisphaerae bacterium]|nr:MFS transporter [Phycisphaerae bacterium]
MDCSNVRAASNEHDIPETLPSTGRQSGLHLPNLLVLNRNFVLLWAAYGISAIGDHLSEMALLKERGGLERPDVTRLQALLTFGFFLPFVIFGPIGGWWADRFSRKWSMIGADLARAGVMASLSFALPIAAGGTLISYLGARGWGDYSAALPLFFTGAFAAFFAPARNALLPTLIRNDQIVRANALLSAMGTIGGILSAWLGGMLVDLSEAGHFDLHWNYRLDGLTFLVSAACLLFIAMRKARQQLRPRVEGLVAPIVQGFRYVRQHRRVLQMILLGTVFWAAAGVIISIVPALVRDVFGGRFSDAGLYRGLIAAGLAAGAAVLTLIGPAAPLQLRVLTGLFWGAFWLFALEFAYVWRLGKFFTGLCLFGMGGAGAVILVTAMAMLQHLVPNSRRGRVFGANEMATTASLVIATGLLGLPEIPNLDRYIPYLIAATGLMLLIALIAAWREYRRKDPFPAIMSFLWLIQRFYAQFWLRVERVGPCTVPRHGPVILAINHTAGVDPMAIYATCRHRLTGFVVAREYFEIPILGWFQRLANCIPIDRQNPTKSFLTSSLRFLRQGGCLAIFPEGTFHDPHEPPPPVRPGVGVLALWSGATVIPCHISGTKYHSNPIRSYLARHKIRVRYGAPVDLSAFAGRAKQREAQQEVSELIMAKIRELGPRDSACE